jgi:CheY-specific phosphatase CheX
MMTKEQVSCALQAQHQKDLRFGEMAVNMGFLSSEQLTQVLNEQRRNYLYVGDALVKLGALTQGQRDSALERFNQEQKTQIVDEIIMPDGIPHQSIWEIVIDMSCKMLTRVASLPFHLGPGSLVEHCLQRPVTVATELTGVINARLLITLSEKSQDLLAHGILNDRAEESFPCELLDETLLQFVDLVFGNAVNKANLLGHQIEIGPPSLQRCEEIKENKTEIGLMFPIHLPGGEVIEITIIAPGLKLQTDRTYTIE